MYELLLALFSNNFMYYANFFMVIIFAYMIYKEKFKYYITGSVTFFVLIIGTLSYCILYLKNYDNPSSSILLLRYIAPLVLFYCGFIRVREGVNTLKNDTMVIAFSSCLHGILNVFYNRNLNILTIAGRQYNDIYGDVIAGTLQNLFFVTSSALLFYFISVEKHKVLKMTGVIASLCGVYGSIMNASRTMIIVTFLVFFISMFIYMHTKYGFSSAIFRYFCVVLALLIGVFLCLWLDLFNIQEWFANTALGKRASINTSGHMILDNVRWTYSIDILKLLPQYPFGGVPYASYAHNLWVDIAKEAGVIPFVLYILFFICIIKTTMLFYGNKNVDYSYKVFFVPIVITFFLVFFTEPIMEGMPIIFSLFCFVVGGLTGFNKASKYEKNSV